MTFSHNVYFIFLVVVVSSVSLFSEIIKEQVWQWKGMHIFWFYDIIDPEKRGLEFKATRKNISSQTYNLAFETLLEKGEYKVDRKNFFYTISHSGGESGGTLFLRIFYPHRRKLEFLVLETTGYAEFKFVDFDRSGNEEIFTQNTDFYGLQFKTKKEKACINLPPVYVSGLNNDYYFPKYFQIANAEERGKFKLIEVTFSPLGEIALRPYLTRIEKFLENHKNSTITDIYMLPPIFQYYDYMRKLNREKEALLKLKNSRIKLETSCDEKKRVRTFLGLVVAEYFKNQKQKE